MKTKWLKAEELTREAKKHILSALVVLDIGCGIMPQRYVTPLVHICFEPYLGYVRKLKTKVKNEQDRSYLILNGTWKDATELFPAKSVDTVFLLDIIEHLEKSEAKKLIRLTERIARKQIVIFTTLGFMPQHHEGGRDAWGLYGGKWQEHKSGWWPKDFDQTWQILACKRYHFADNLGRPFKKPYGALWAIKNMRGNFLFRDRLSLLNATAVRAHSLFAIRTATSFFAAIEKIKKTIWFLGSIFVGNKK